MNRITRQSGFSAIELIIVLAILGAVGFIGYSVYDRQQSTSQSSVASDVPAAPEINSTDDLDTAKSMLDSTNVESSSDTSQLDANLAQF